MIGNGFDVSLGIKSSYSEFYKWYCDQPSELEHIEEFKKSIQDDMNRDVPDDEKTWADFEVGLGQYTTKFTPDTVSNFLDCLDDAQANIVNYLKEQEQEFYFNEFTKNSILEFETSFLNFYEEVTDQDKITLNSVCNGVRNDDREITVVSFNYTKTLEVLFECFQTYTLASWSNNGFNHSCKLNPNIIHVHGTTSLFPIIGVNDESQVANKALLDTPQLQEVIIKAKAVNALGQLWHSQAEEQISKSKIVCIFGMSLGPTDAKWWRKLSVWLKASGDRHVIIYWYEKNPPNGISIRKQLMYERNVKEKFLSYATLSEAEKDSLKNRIHVIINTNKFLKISRYAESKDEDHEESTELVLT